MRTSIATVSLSGDLEEKLTAIAAVGFDGVEIFDADFLTFDGGPRSVGEMIRGLGLACVTFQPFRDFEGMPEPQRSRGLDRAERKFDVMAEVGTDLLLVCSNVSPASLGGIDRAAADLRALAERAAARDMRIGYEALAWGRHVSDHRDAWEIVRRADHPGLGLVLDTYHTLAKGVPVPSIASIPAERIALVQVADAPAIEMDLLSRSRHFRNMPGQGDLDLAGFMAALDATGYDGVLSLEIFNDQFRAGTARQVALDGRRALIDLCDRVAHANGSPRWQPRPLPPRGPPRGIEFVEFTADDESGAALAGLLARLGFRRVGTHRTKQVALWRQGEVNLVLNTDAEGFAHAAYIMHGPSICAICLRVADAGQTMERARRLLAQPFSQPVGPGETEIPAIRGVGGSLLYFVEPSGRLSDLWEVDFELHPEPQDPVGITAIDHIAQSMSYDELLSWRLAYTTLFEMDRTAQVDIADPGGLVRSEAIQSPDRSVRIALNSAQGGRTQSARFLSEFFGSGTHHVALATDDIFDTVRRIRANGQETLTIPDNYYDDLEPRFDLPPALAADLRRHHVLYDRDETGDFFQAYLPVFADRFFFEIVQRRDYAGFGAANAPVRLAAQARARGGAGRPVPA